MRRRPARSTGLLMKSSVMNTERSGVLAAIQRRRRLLGQPERDRVRAQVPDRDEPRRERADDEHAAHERPRRQRGSARPARIATAIHMIWKYLFMSNSTALTTTTFGTMNSATIQATRNQRARHPAGGERGDDRQHERDAQVGEVEERDRRRAVLEARLAPAQHEPERPDVALPDDRVRR